MNSMLSVKFWKEETPASSSLHWEFMRRTRDGRTYNPAKWLGVKLHRNSIDRDGMGESRVGGVAYSRSATRERLVESW